MYSNLLSFFQSARYNISLFHRIEHLKESKEFLLDPLADCVFSRGGGEVGTDAGHKFKLDNEEFLTS